MRAAWFAIALVACSNHHPAKKDSAPGGDGSAAACTLDSQCTAVTGEKCCSGVCTQTGDCSFAVLGVTRAEGFVNGGAWVVVSGAGFTPDMKVFIGDGRAPVRVDSATTALIQTPPGPAGMQDVKIVSGAQTAALPGGFQYRTAGLETTWEQKPLQVVRGEDPGIAVLQDGRVLIAGGTTVPDMAADALATAEIYDPSTDTVGPAANTMSTVRWHNGAITLMSGKVLVVGGATGVGDETAGDLFDPVTNKFTPTTGKLNRPRIYVRAVLLTDGRVFISSENDATIELYDPKTDTFTLVDHTVAHVYGFAVRLRDGRVLLGAGDGGTHAAEVFDFDANTVTPAMPMVQSRSMLTAHTLPSGQVLVIAGASMDAGAIQAPLASMETFDPTTLAFTATGYSLVTPRTWHASALVRDGTVLVMGGYTVAGQCGSSVASVEQVDPGAGTVAAFPMLPNTNTEWTAAVLQDGSIVGVGGGACQTSMALPDIDFLKGAPIQ